MDSHRDTENTEKDHWDKKIEIITEANKDRRRKNASVNVIASSTSWLSYVKQAHYPKITLHGSGKLQALVMTNSSDKILYDINSLNVVSLGKKLIKEV